MSIYVYHTPYRYPGCRTLRMCSNSDIESDTTGISLPSLVAKAYLLQTYKARVALVR